MNYYVFLSALLGFSFIYYLIGKRCKEDSSSADTFFLSKRNFGVFSITLTILATQIGGGTLLGGSDEAYRIGWKVLFFPLGMSIGLILMGCGWGSKLRKLEISTIAEVFEKSYGSSFLRKFCSIISSIALFGILIAQGVAARKFFASLGLDSEYIFYLFWIFVIAYTAMGGLKAVIQTDVIQILFILSILLGMFIYIQTTYVVKVQSVKEVIFDTGAMPSISLFLMPLLFMLMGQDMAQRCFSAKNGRVASVSAWIAGISLFLVCLLAVYFGVLLKQSGIVLASSNGALMTFAMQTMSRVFVSLIACAIVMAILSTADSLLCSIASNVVFDVVPNQKASAGKLSSWIVTILGLSSMVIATYFDNIVAIILPCYELCTLAFFPAISLAIFRNHWNQRSALISVSIGLIGFVFFKVYDTSLPGEVITLFCSYLGFFVIEKLLERSKVSI